MTPFHWSHGADEAPLLLCLHGIGSCADGFLAQRDLADRCGRRVVAWDAPGYRHSEDPAEAPGLDGWADAAADLIRHLGYEQADVIGVSWGGVTATRMTLRHPELVRTLILADTSVGSGTTPERAESMRARAAAVTELGVEGFATTRAPALFSEGVDRALVDEAARYMIDSVRMPNYQWACDAMAEADHRAELGRIEAPTLVICGEHDAVTPPTLSQQLHAGIEGSELVFVPEAGHLANQEQPAVFNDAVASFLDRQSHISPGG